MHRLIIILASLCHNEPAVKTEMEQVCDMYIKQNSTFVSEVIIEAAASQKIWEKFTPTNLYRIDYTLSKSNSILF